MKTKSVKRQVLSIQILLLLGQVLALPSASSLDSVEDEVDDDHDQDQGVNANVTQPKPIRVCGNEKASLFIAPKASVKFRIPEVFNGGTTVFVKHAPTYRFACRLFDPEDDPEKLKITFDSKRQRSKPEIHEDEESVSRLFNTSLTKALHGVNQMNQTVTCFYDDRPICKATLIILKIRKQTDCLVRNVTGKISCPLNEIAEALQPREREPQAPFLTGDGLAIARNFDHYLSSDENVKFEKTIKYSILNSTNHWVECQAFDKNSTALKSATARYYQNSFRCPKDNGTLFEPWSAMLVRVEQNEKKGFAAAIPTLAKDESPLYAYFLVNVSSAAFNLDLESNGESTTKRTIDEDEEIVNTVVLPAVLTILFVTAVSIIAISYLLHSRKKLKAKVAKAELKPGSGGDMEMPSLLVPASEASGCTDCTDLSSTKSGYCDRHNPGFMFAKFFENLSDASKTDFTRLIKEAASDYKMNLDNVVHDPEEWDKLRRIIVNRQLSGNPSSINPDLRLDQQAHAIPYDPKLEIDRENFTCSMFLGDGNFGCVYKGVAKGLFHPNSETCVAVKTVRNAMDFSQTDSLLIECKILASLELHMNLVNLMGSCTSSLQETGEMWLLLEYCSHGNLKTFLINNRKEFKNNIDGVLSTPLNSRLLIQWAYHIAKGMEYLATKRVMHGDLAARNVLVSGDENQLVVKVSDFGLSKNLYDNVRYKKEKRRYVPWKWMAIEYLKDCIFSIKSDVWSYGVVLWELFALGKEPYSGMQNEDEILKGYRLSCPDFLQKESQWNSKNVYDDITKDCWLEEKERATFPEIVAKIEKELYHEELEKYNELTKEYEAMSQQMMDPDTRLKRASSRKKANNPNYKKAAAHLEPVPEDTSRSRQPSTSNNGYQEHSAVLPVNSPLLHVVNGNRGYISLDIANKTPSGYVTMTSSHNQVIDHTPSPPPAGYVRATAES